MTTLSAVVRSDVTSARVESNECCHQKLYSGIRMPCQAGQLEAAQHDLADAVTSARARESQRKRRDRWYTVNDMAAYRSVQSPSLRSPPALRRCETACTGVVGRRVSR